MDLKIDQIKNDWTGIKSTLDTDLDGLEALLDQFGPIADQFSVDGKLSPVEDQWKKCTAAFQNIKNSDRQINKYNTEELDKDGGFKNEIVRFKNRINDIKNDFNQHNTTFRACGSNARHTNSTKGATKKEEIKIPVFDPETSDWESWSKLMISEAENYDNDQLKKNFLLTQWSGASDSPQNV